MKALVAPAAPLSGFRTPRTGDKFTDKDYIRKYVYDLIQFTGRNIVPTKEDNRKE